MGVQAFAVEEEAPLKLEDFEIGRILHLKFEIRNRKLDTGQFPISEMQDSSNFKIFQFQTSDSFEDF